MKHLTTKAKIIGVLLFFGMMMSCKTKEKIVTKNHLSKDTTIHHRTEVHTLPTNYKTIIPCKEANQVIETGGTKVVFKTIRDTLRVFVEVPSTVQVQDSTSIDTSLKVSEVTKETITKYRTPKWAWYSLIINIGLLGWIFRKPISKLILPL